jgi:hypothetical protein
LALWYFPWQKNVPKGQHANSPPIHRWEQGTYMMSSRRDVRRVRPRSEHPSGTDMSGMSCPQEWIPGLIACCPSGTKRPCVSIFHGNSQRIKFLSLMMPIINTLETFTIYAPHGDNS